MRFGVCTGIKEARRLAEAGYDYIELSVAGDLVPDEADRIWVKKRREIEGLPLRPEAFNSFVRTGKIVGPEADAERLRRYVNCAFTRAAEVGGEVIVFGSGGARNLPDGFPVAQATTQLHDFLGYCADAYEKTGVRVAIEPLARNESNVLHTVSAAAELARQVGRPGVCVLADTYHMEQNDDPLDALTDYDDLLAHTHTADTNRDAPGTGVYDHVAFFRALRAAHYDSRLSIEGNWPRDFVGQLARSLAHLRAAYTRSAQ